MNNDDLIILATDLEGDTRVLAEKCRELIADLRIARQDAAQSKIEIKSLQNGGQEEVETKIDGLPMFEEMR